MAFLPEPLRMIALNPRLFDLTSDGPIAYVARQKLVGSPALPPDLSLRGKTVLVTGATSGVGCEAARKFLQLGARLIIGARDLDKAESLKQTFLGQVPGAPIHVSHLQMESFDSVDAFVNHLGTLGIRLDIALLNAGLFSREQRRLSDGCSLLMQVNLRSTAYLALRLVPLLVPIGHETVGGTTLAPPSRLVLVSSEAHAWSTYDPPSQGDLLAEFCDPAASVDPSYEYYTAKLLLALFGRELARRLDAASVEVVTTTPGFCASNFFPDSTNLLTKLISWAHARSADQGGRLHVHAATCTEPHLSGKYMRDGHVNKLSPVAESDKGEKLQGRLWEEMVKLCSDRGHSFHSSI
ncbi:short-chain dehydrogenase reductase family [Colletotrichum musicola]|uniref:Short-chain dehydrogenase reductase family n=1 Tax=Colletotrichum musicola TaxID=2175873 RepID=A0A8H6NB44_9PEZI|nr:short-chain dehydrogenase reductase family [Colletotrichum musicola]